MEAGSPIMSGTDALDGFMNAAGGAPDAAALVCDIDGTISPIAPTPADAHVPAAFRELLAALTRRLGLVVFATGRALEDGRRMIPLEGAAYVGTHGLETMAPDGSVTVDPQAERYVPLIRDVAEGAARDLDCEAPGGRDRGQAHRPRRPLPPGGGRRRHAARDPDARDRARARARARHRHRPLRLRGAAAAPVHQGLGRPAAPRGRRLPLGASAAATTSPTSPRSPPSATGASGTRGGARWPSRRSPTRRRDPCWRPPTCWCAPRPASTRCWRGWPGPSAPSDRSRTATPATRQRRLDGRAAPVAPQRPPNSGARFSRNAAMPSVWSSVANASAKRSLSIPCPVAMSVSAAALTAALQ